MMSFDLGRMEIYGDKTLDNVSLDRIRKEVIAQYERGVCRLSAGMWIIL